MLNEYIPLAEQWYRHIDQGQPFLVVATDEDAEVIEVQYFDGTLEEISYYDWSKLELEPCEQPDSWAGTGDMADWDIDFLEEDELSDSYEDVH
jgi:hypothetical protein